MEVGETESPLLEALVHHHESAVVPRENFRAVTPLRHEDEEVACEEVLLPLVANDGAQTIDGIPHVDGLCSEKNPDGPGQTEHASPQRGNELGDVPGVGADREPHMNTAGEAGLDQPGPRLRRGRRYNLDGQKCGPRL